MTANTKTIWTIDPSHSIVQFKVKHLAVSNVSGNLNAFSLNFGLLTEAGSLVVGEEVKLHFDIQLIKQGATKIEATSKGLHALTR